VHPYGHFPAPVNMQAAHGRPASVRLSDTLVNEELIRQGLAWALTRYCDKPICQARKKLEEEARNAKRGLRSMPDVVPPWEFRSAHISRKSPSD
jgi:endonuclease YncB( thermonuclease family)